MSISIYMENITVGTLRSGLPELTIASRHDVTHCITKVGTLQDFICMDGDFVIPEFEFSLDNTDNETYWPNYPDVRNCQEYYTKYIKGGRVHVDVRYITATSNISLFYGCLDSTIPAINYDTAEITFRATHIIKRSLTEISMSWIISQDPYTGDRRGSVWEKYFDLPDLLPKSFGPGQMFSYANLPDYLTTVNSGTKKNYSLLRIHKSNLEQYDTQLDFLGDFLRSMVSNIVWVNNTFSVYPITTIWAANATMALDDYLTEITKSEPWEDAASDVMVDAGETSLTHKDYLAKTGDYSDGRRVRRTYIGRDDDRRDFVNGWYSVSSSRKIRYGIRSSVMNSNGTRTIDAQLIDHLRIPTMYYNLISTQYKSEHPYSILLADIIMPHLVTAAHSFWCTHKVKLEVEAEGLAYYPGRQYSIAGTAWKCVQTEKDLEMETTKLTIVGAA